MKVGAEDRKKLIALVVLAVAATAAVVYMLSTLGGNTQPVAAARVTPPRTGLAQPARGNGRGPAVAVASNSLDPELKLQLLESSEGTKYEGSGRNIFTPSLEPIPTALAKGLKEKPMAPALPPGPPPPPPIPLKFFGFANHPGEPKRIFLAQGDDVFIAEEGQIVDRRYKVLRINPTSVEIEDVLNNNHQTLPLTSS